MTKKIVFKIIFRIVDGQVDNFKKIVSEINQNNTSFCGMFSENEKLGTVFYDYYFSEVSLNGSLIERFKNNQSAMLHLKNFVSGEYFQRLKSTIVFEKFTVLGNSSDELKELIEKNKPKKISIEFRNFSTV